MSERLRKAFASRNVLVTGHTGFKGSWMSEWLLDLGANVTGVSLEVETTPALFDQLGLRDRLDHRVVDIRRSGHLADVVAEIRPDFVFHLAAQPLVRLSYVEPVETFSTNTFGTLQVLDALRALDHQCHAVMVTTDKCYENDGRTTPYREDDPMGGHDPYSASKGAAEIVIASYRRSFFPPSSFGTNHRIGVASARAGNVIGGGDWALDRIVPDAMRALGESNPVKVRNPEATRPWQHVLEPLGGYLRLAMAMSEAGTPERREEVFSGFNFGPEPDATRSVRALVETILSNWDGSWVDVSTEGEPHEASYLALAIDKARLILGWVPRLTFTEAVTLTTDWYREVGASVDVARRITGEQIARYQELIESDL